MQTKAKVQVAAFCEPSVIRMMAPRCKISEYSTASYNFKSPPYNELVSIYRGIVLLHINKIPFSIDLRWDASIRIVVELAFVSV